MSSLGKTKLSAQGGILVGKTNTCAGGQMFLEKDQSVCWRLNHNEKVQHRVLKFRSHWENKNPYVVGEISIGKIQPVCWRWDLSEEKSTCVLEVGAQWGM